MARSKDRQGKYLLLDGHCGTLCLDTGQPRSAVSSPKDDEAFTYNKRINRLATIQEHFMIVRAIDRGVSEERLAKALNLDVRRIRRRRTMLAGISPEVVDLLKDKSVNPGTFEVLRKMRPMRQIEAAELMNTAGNYTSSYAKALLAATRQADLVKPTSRSGSRHDSRADGAHGTRDGDAAAGREERRIAVRRRRAPSGDRVRISLEAGRQSPKSSGIWASTIQKFSRIPRNHLCDVPRSKALQRSDSPDQSHQGPLLRMARPNKHV